MKKICLEYKTLEKIKENESICVDCKICFKPCPMMKKYSSSPKTLMKEILEEKQVNQNIPYSCMLCDICTVKCPKDIDLKDIFYSMRKDAFKEKDKHIFKEIGYNTVKFHQINSFSPIFSKTFADKNTKKIFLPGCSLSSYSPELVIKTYEYLKKNIDDLSIAFECCGKPTLSMGDVEKFESYYEKLNNIFSNDEVVEIIVACPNCLKTIKEHSKNIKVTSLWSIINEYKVDEKLINYYEDLETEFSLHDPCPIRKEYKIHDDVRGILKSIGIKVVEFEKNRENSECCGSGGMLRVTNKEISTNQSKKRANEAKSDTVVSYCQSCCESMMLAGKNILHVLDFLFNEDVIRRDILSQRKTSTLKKWSNRYNGIKLAKSKNRTS
ncbi:MAG: (Fe-S)-binding protein [Romboutsia sp.]